MGNSIFDRWRKRKSEEPQQPVSLPEAQGVSQPEQTANIPDQIVPSRVQGKPAVAGAPQQRSTLEALISGIEPKSNIPDKIDESRTSEKPSINKDDNQLMLDDLITKPLTPEEVEARKRAATAVGAVGQLGNLISSYANLAGTTQGTAPMTIPGYQGPNIDSWQDKAIQRQKEYANIMNGLSAQEWEQAYKDREAARAQANADREYQLKADAAAENKRQFDENQKRLREQAEAELKSLDAYRQGQVKANQTRADKTGTTKTGGSGTPNNDTISAGDYEYTFNRREGNSATWKGIYQAIPQDWLVTQPSGEQVHWYDNTSDMTRKQQELIIRYAQEHPEFMEDMMNRYPSVLSRKKIGGEDETFDLNGNDTFDLTK